MKKHIITLALSAAAITGITSLTSCSGSAQARELLNRQIAIHQADSATIVTLTNQLSTYAQRHSIDSAAIATQTLSINVYKDDQVKMANLATSIVNIANKGK